MGEKKGAVDFSLSTLVVLIMVLFLTMSSGGFISELQDALARGYTNLDMIRVQQSVHQISEEGAAKVVLRLHNEYDSITAAGGGGDIGFDADFISATDPKGVSIPEEFMNPGERGTLTDIKELCIVKEGRDVNFASMSSCYLDQCNADRSLTNGELCDMYPQNDRDTQDSDNVFSGDGHDQSEVPIGGYMCDNGVYKHVNTSYKMYRKYCNPAPSHFFVDINKVSCPNSVIESWGFMCVVKTTTRCLGGAELFISANDTALPRNASRKIECRSGGIQHYEVGVPLNISNRALNYDVNFSVKSEIGGLAWRSEQNIRAIP